MGVTIPSLSDVTDILDTDMVMVTQSGGQTYKISGADLNKRNQAVIANSTTLTGAPLKTGNIVRAYFTADITGVNTTTGLVLNYNNSNKNVKVPKDGALVNFTAQNMGGSPTVYKYLQAYTTLELLYDGTNFVIIGNPVVISSSDYTIYADGLKRQDTIDSSKNFATCNAVNKKLGYEFLIDAGNSETEVFLQTSVNITRYKYLLFIIRWSDSPYIYDTRILPVNVFRTYGRQIFVENIDGSRARFKYIDDTHIGCRMQNGQYDAYYEVVGML